MNLLSARFFVLPGAALAIIVALAQTQGQAQGQAGTRASEPTVTRAAPCAMAPVLDARCSMALNTPGATVIR